MSDTIDPKIKNLEEENINLHKENNFLKLKVELLLDMLAQKSAETDILQKDIDQIRKCLLPQASHIDSRLV